MRGLTRECEHGDPSCSPLKLQAIESHPGSYDARCPREAVGPTFRAGDRVSARWRGGRRWYAGSVTAVSADGTRYEVAYDDGDVENGVRAISCRIRPLT